MGESEVEVLRTKEQAKWGKGHVCVSINNT